MSLGVGYINMESKFYSRISDTFSKWSFVCNGQEFILYLRDDGVAYFTVYNFGIYKR